MPIMVVERGVKPEQGGELFLPPGFRFHPTDEEVITSYLLQKLLNPSFTPRAMGEVNLNKCEPWDLPSKAKMGEKEWYFFCHKDMKYPTGMRTNRATKEGYWKATGKDREIFKPASSSAAAGGRERELVGMKKTLVFYMGRAPRGSKTNWVMHEFRLEGKYRNDNSILRLSPKDEWVVCKVFHKNNNGEEDHKKAAPAAAESPAVVGTPNVSSISVVDATGDDADGDDFINSLIDPMYFHSNSTSSLPDLTTMDAASDYSKSSFIDLPPYTLTTGRDNLNQQAAAVVAGSAVPTSSSAYYSSSWNLLRHAAGHPVGGSYYSLHDQAMMAKALGGGVVSPDFAAGLPSSSSATGISPQNYALLGRGGYATNDLTTSSAAATVIDQLAAKNLGA